MTSYHGGKQKIGKKLAEIIYYISSSSSIPFKGYCEPFVGMCGVYQYIPEYFKKSNLSYKAGDQNKSLILMWDNVINKAWKPPTKIYTKEEYELLRSDSNSSALKGFIGHAYSFGGQYFIGYRRSYSNDNDSRFIKSAEKILEIGEKLKNVKFKHGSYEQFSKLKNYIIYCDPPYQKDSRYYDEKGSLLKFDYDKFWNWCKTMAKNNMVFVSEYKVPKDDKIKLVFSKPVINTKKGVKHKNNEKLYLILP